MRYLSLFSGIEAATVAWKPLGWEPVAFCEVDPFPSAVLAHHYPDIPNLGDITKVDWDKFKEEYGEIDIIIGGSPCQSFSVAGNRKGLQGESKLMFEYVRAIREVMPRYFIWENVPGALSSGPKGQKGSDFGCLLRELANIGRSVGGKRERYGLAWRVLDASLFGVPQRRRRVFLVGCLGTDSAAEILFEPDSLRGDNPSSKQKREELARAVGRGVACEGGTKGRVKSEQPIVADGVTNAIPLDTRNVFRDGGKNDGTGLGVGEVDEPAFTLTTAHSHAVSYCEGFKYHQGAKAGGLGNQPEQSPTLTADYHNPAVCIQGSMIGRKDKNGPNGDGINVEQSFTLNCTDRHAVSYKVNADEEARPCGGDGRIAGTLTANSSFNRQNIIVDQAACFAQNTRNEVRLQNGDGEITGPVCASVGCKGQGVPFVMASRQANAEITKDMSPTLLSAHERPILCCSTQRANCSIYSDGSAPTLLAAAGTSGNNQPYICEPSEPEYVIRRLMPIECERLQGFPDNYTDIPWKGKEHAPDGKRYKAIGNSFAVPVVRWLGERLQEVNRHSLP